MRFVFKLPKKNFKRVSFTKSAYTGIVKVVNDDNTVDIILENGMPLRFVRVMLQHWIIEKKNIGGVNLPPVGTSVVVLMPTDYVESAFIIGSLPSGAIEAYNNKYTSTDKSSVMSFNDGSMEVTYDKKNKEYDVKLFGAIFNVKDNNGSTDITIAAGNIAFDCDKFTVNNTSLEVT